MAQPVETTPNCGFKIHHNHSLTSLIVDAGSAVARSVVPASSSAPAWKEQSGDLLAKYNAVAIPDRQLYGGSVRGPSQRSKLPGGSPNRYE